GLTAWPLASARRILAHRLGAAPRRGTTPCGNTVGSPQGARNAAPESMLPARFAARSPMTAHLPLGHAGRIANITAEGVLGGALGPRGPTHPETGQPESRLDRTVRTPRRRGDVADRKSVV